MCKSKSFNALFTVLTVLLASYCFWTDSKATLGSPVSAASTSLTRNSILTRIDEIEVGTRVWADNPEGHYDDSLGDFVDPGEWKHLRLTIEKLDGTISLVELLRPLWWVAQFNAEPGNRIALSIPECGIDGEATVTNVLACPEIEPGPGSVVTGKFCHTASSFVTVHLNESSDAIDCTGNHPFWSETRQRFVQADALSRGERLHCLSQGDRLTVNKVVPNWEPQLVFNLEVHGTHVYSISTAGVLVHNGCSDEIVSVFTATNGPVNLNRPIGQGSGGMGGTHVTYTDITNPRDYFQHLSTHVPGSSDPTRISRIEVGRGSVAPDPTGDVFPHTGWIGPDSSDARVVEEWDVTWPVDPRNGSQSPVITPRP